MNTNTEWSKKRGSALLLNSKELITILASMVVVFARVYIKGDEAAPEPATQTHKDDAEAPCVGAVVCLHFGKAFRAAVEAL